MYKQVFKNTTHVQHILDTPQTHKLSLKRKSKKKKSKKDKKKYKTKENNNKQKTNLVVFCNKILNVY
jgi:hypothetical protein